MSFAAKPFSAAGPQSASSQRAGLSTRSWALQQRRLVPGREASVVSSGARLSGWSEESHLHRIQPEFTFEFWCAPSSRRRLTTVSRTASPTEAALAPVLLPVGGFACHCSSGNDVQTQDSAFDSVSKQTSPTPSSTGSSTDAADEEVEIALVQPTSRLSTPPLKQQCQRQLPPSPLPATPAPPLPTLRRQQQRPLNRSLSAGPSDQLLNLVRLSYTHSDLATRRLLKSSLLHRNRRDPSSVTAAPAAEIADSGNVSGSNDSSRAVSTTTSSVPVSGLLTRRRFPMPTPIGMRASGEQPPIRLWSRDQCLSLPPLVPNS